MHETSSGSVCSIYQKNLGNASQPIILHFCRVNFFLKETGYSRPGLLHLPSGCLHYLRSQHRYP